MSAVFQSHLQKFITLSDQEFQAILSYFKPVSVKKKENLLEEGQVCRSHFFVSKGCLRKFFINEKGVEQTTEFAIEQWWMTDLFAYDRKAKTQFYIQAVESSALLVLQHNQQEKLLQEHPLMEKYFRCVYQKAYAATQMRIRFIYGFSREQMYHHFRKGQPEFLQRIPQYLLASYLNVTPEYLSQIRKRKRS